MTIVTEKFIRKALYVDAVRITAANFNEIEKWCQGIIEVEETRDEGPNRHYIKVRVHNPKNPRQTKAFVGDWLLYTERGYKVYTNKAFHASFDLVVALVEEEEDPIEIVEAKSEPLPDYPEPEFLPATPEAIRDAVVVNEEKVEPSAVEGKRVLSVLEQEDLSSEEIRELVQSGEAVLAQDIAQP